MNNISILDVINKWIKYSEYNPDQKSFILGSSNYYMNEASKLASSLLENYDNTGNMSVIVLREAFIKILKNEKIDILSIVENPKLLDKTIEMYNVFHSDNVIEAYNNFNDTLGKMYQDIIGIDLISDSNENQFNYGKQVEYIIKDLDRLHLDIYKKGNESLKIDKFYKKLLVFNSLGEAILKLENAKDGVYTCYINIGYTADSYFGFFVKSGENFIAYTDRIDEAYPGQHKRLNVRNGRWAENKSDKIFPYDTLLDYDEYCAKGYATKFRVKKEFNSENNEIEFKNLNTANGYDGLLLGMLLLRMKYDDTKITGDNTYVESLLTENIKVIQDSSKYDLMNIGTSDIAIRNKSIDIHFSNDQILKDKIPFKGFYNTDVVKYYGDGFVPDYNEIYSSTNLKYLIEDNKDNIDIRPEYVGNEERIKVGAYYIIREQLKNYINHNIEKEWKEYGGLKAYKKWYIDAAKNNLNHIIALCMQEYINQDLSKKEEHSWNTDKFNMKFICNAKYAKDLYVMNDCYLNDKTDKGDFKCTITGNASTVFFVITPKEFDGIKEIVNKEDKDVPNMIKLGISDTYAGNSLLNMVDPVKTVIKPFSDLRINGEYTKFSFTIAIGMSKRAINKIVKMMIE